MKMVASESMSKAAEISVSKLYLLVVIFWPISFSEEKNSGGNALASILRTGAAALVRV
jgi:hypothetical protein